MPTRRDFLKTTAALAASPYLLQPVAAQPPASTFETFDDFESGTYDAWTLEGDCWGGSPPSDQIWTGRIRGFEGKRFLCTLHPLRGANAIGRAISREFRIERPFVHFLIGGGKYPGEACLNLLVDGKVVRTETGNDSPEFQQAFWDVAEWIGKQAHFEVVDSTRAAARGYIMVDAIRLADHPPFRERVPGQNAFFCFSQEDNAGRLFQSLFSTPEGRGHRALSDFCIDHLTERLALLPKQIDRKDVNQCATLLQAEVDRIFARYQVRDALVKQLIAANSCSALTALLTTYDYDLQQQIENSPLTSPDYITFRRKPEIVLQQGKAVCSGISGLEQRLALSFQDLGLECLVANGYTRQPDDTPYKRVNHAWTLYYMADRNLWAPSDSTRALAELKSAKRTPKGTFARSAFLLVDPLLRDMYSLFHFVKDCNIGYPGAPVKDRVVNVLSQPEWNRFHQSHPYVLKSAHNLLRQLDKEDVARLT